MRSMASGLALGILACILIVSLSMPNMVRSAQDVRPDRVVVRDVDFLGRVALSTGLLSYETEIGGLSALTYDGQSDTYYVLSDDRSVRNPARFYTVSIDLSDGSLTPGDIVFEGATTLLDASGQPYPSDSIDPEGIALSQQGTVFISSEDALVNSTRINPFVNEYELSGQLIRELTIPEKFLHDGSGLVGTRDNLAFESLTLMPNADFLLTAVENALLQDGPASDVGQPSLSRILTLNTNTGQPTQETVYQTGPAQAPVSPNIPQGLVEMIALDNNGTLLTLERGPSTTLGLAVQLYVAQSQGALSVGKNNSLFWQDGAVPFDIETPVIKELLLDFADLGLPFVNNFEGMALGPILPDGRQSLILVSDNNFSLAPTEFVALALTLETIHAAIPSLETPLTLDEPNPTGGALPGKANDPAIWLHPIDPADSLVALTQQDGGLILLDMAGAVRQTVTPPVYGDVRYTSVDVVYNFPLGANTADVFIAADRRNDTLAVFQINPNTRRISDITSSLMLPTIFGVDDGERTANGLAAYASARDGATYVFVTQASGNLVAQIELTSDGAGLVAGNVVRLLELPAPAGDPAAGQAEGVVVDRFQGYLYAAVENAGILKFDARPDGGNDYSIIHSANVPYLQPPIKGLTIYYGAGDSGYLLASSQGDHTYAVFNRAGANDYIGSFIVANEGMIDQANATTGLDVSHLALGPLFPNGMLIVQDSANDPQNSVVNGPILANNSTNFKFVRWDNVAGAFEDQLLIDVGSYNPRYPMRVLLPTVSGE